MEGSKESYDALLQKGVDRLHGHERRLFMAEVALELCGGSGRRAEQRFGWGRATVNQGLHELKSGIRCLRNVAVRRRFRWEEEASQRSEDIRAIMEPHTQVDPELKSERRYSNLSAREVLDALRQKGYADQDLPKERTMRNILNRMNYRLKSIQKGKPLKKTAATDAIFANVQAVRAEVKNEPTVLEISADTKAKVNEGEYARGGKNPERRGRHNAQGVGPRSAGQA
jgi:Rhodopirellula transposase DDE domain